jgi:hypothetical protein
MGWVNVHWGVPQDLNVIKSSLETMFHLQKVIELKHASSFLTSQTLGCPPMLLAL